MIPLLTCTAVVPIAILLWKFHPMLRVHVEVGNNNSTLATENFLSLINAAELTMLISDDGDAVCESIYNNDYLIQVVADRLETNPHLELYCIFFDAEADNKFKQRFDTHPRVHIRKIRPRQDIHVKIIDGGKRGYLTSHSIGSEDRKYRKYDCTKASGKAKEMVFGQHIRFMETAFPELETARV